MPIQAVCEAIGNLLERGINEGVHIEPGTFNVFLGPPDADTEDDPELILFPIRVTPTGELRNARRVRPFPTADDPPREMEGAVPLDLHFLVTAGSPQNDTTAASLRRLGDAIRAIEAASPIAVPAAFQDAVWLSLEPLTTDDLSRIWGMFPNFNARTCFTFRASPVWIDPAAPPEPAPPVIFDEAGHRAIGSG
jgi:hypothetical protein